MPPWYYRHVDAVLRGCSGGASVNDSQELVLQRRRRGDPSTGVGERELPEKIRAMHRDTALQPRRLASPKRRSPRSRSGESYTRKLWTGVKKKAAYPPG